MKLNKLTILFLIFYSLNTFAAMNLELLSFSTPNMNLNEVKTQTVSLSQLQHLLKQLSTTGQSAPSVRVVIIEGILTSPPSRGLVPFNRSAQLKIKSKTLNMEELVTLRPNLYNRIKIGLSRPITTEDDIKDMLVEAESIGTIGDVKLAFIIDYQ